MEPWQQYLEEMALDLVNKSQEELTKLYEEQDEQMRLNILAGREDLGFSLWCGVNCEEASAWREKVLKDAAQKIQN
jgi:hypothetical protein